MANEQTRIDFANSMLADWNQAMDQFCRAVDRARDRGGMNEADTKAALIVGYGYEVADAWDEWVSE